MKTIFKWLKGIAKLINFTRLLVINSLFFLIVILFIAAYSIDEPKVSIANNSTLHLNFNGSIVEQKQPIDFSSELSKQLLSSSQSTENEYQIDEIIQAIRYAQYDPNITAILLELDGLNGSSINNLADIGSALSEFKQSGKQVTAIADNYSQNQYLLASFADHIHLNPQGIVFLQGYSVYRLYFKEALDKLLITPHIFKVGTYKSFVEPFTENAMSTETKLANSHWLQQLWQDYSSTVINQRKDKSNINEKSLSPSLSQLKSALKKVGGDPALYAKSVGLIDALTTRDHLIDTLKKQAEEQELRFNLVSYDAYQSILPPLYESQLSTQRIALIHANGEIMAGEQNINAIGGTSFSKLLDQALNNNTIKAVVIRINSPGGSAFASEKIRQKILSLQQAGKKVVVSMGSVSASGGYWIASAADHIVAHPTTLTGSIGIFAMFASVDKALNKFGIYNDGVGTSELSTLNPTRTLNPELADIMQLGIEHGYKQFLSVVSEGRDMSVEDVDKVAQGRVWTGIDAKNYGLVDQLGNLQDAIHQAASLAELSDYNIQVIRPSISTKQQLINEMFTASVRFIPESIRLSPSLYQALQSINEQSTIFTRFNDPKGHYAYCPICRVSSSH